MKEYNLFYGFRGSIVFPNQSSIFNYSLRNDSESKNKVFREFFSMIEEKKKYESLYQSRIYYLIYKNKYDDVLHCQLARKKNFNKRELVDNKILELNDNDYPYVNIFIDLKGQKFLIESNTQVFDNYETCGKVIENIINNNLKEKDIKISLNQISSEESFWSYFDKKNKVYNIELKMVAPNMFDAEDDASKFIKEAQKNIGSDTVNINFSNSLGELNPNKIGMDSFIKYVSAGGGSWKLTILGKSGRKEKVGSKQKSIKVRIPILYEEMKKEVLDKNQIDEIIKNFNMIETVENLKENK